jgi:hypothetical protein
MNEQCEYQYGDFVKAIGLPLWADDYGRCSLPAAGKYGGRYFCPVHLDIVMDEEQALADFEASFED